MAYAYRDKYGILHCVKSKALADRYAKGQVAEYNGACEGGYPTVDGLAVFDYGEGEIYIGGNKGSGDKLEVCGKRVQDAVKVLLGDIGI